MQLNIFVYKFDKKKDMEYINSTMKNINDLTDEIYESLCDNDTIALNKSITTLIAILKDVQQSNKEEL